MTDVVVIGGGGSGLRAALAAAEGGASVDLFEKTEDAGGKTKLSIGIMTASQSSFQRRAGIDDTHERHLDDIRSLVHEAGKQIADESMVRFILEQSAEEVEQLAALGVRFSGPHPEGAHKTPRMHVIQPDCR
jgi:fumarate reductase flavoprotein subunit